ncbi:helix-turn-helix domain-containing protein [Propionivibrio soli]|uniref:helix-turn-helix domain-containing protein n=1 Tax=Propionivibrio soli TaxID=2976531 RepID=UPI0021E970E0|nr:helix-turn-helix domain-containing protein [Propionivibrio soli]
MNAHAESITLLGDTTSASHAPHDKRVLSSLRKPKANLHRRVWTASDADEHAQNLSEWNQTYDQLSRGRFSGVITELWTNKAQVFLESTNRQLRQSCAAWPHSIWFGIPDPAGSTAAIDFHGVPANGIAVRQGGVGFELRTPDDFNIYGIVVDREEFRRYAEEVEQTAPEKLLGKADVLLVDMAAKRRLCQRIDALLDEAAFPAPVVASNGCGRDHEPHQAIQDRILGAIVSLLMTQDGQEPPERRAQTRLHRWQTVRRIREYILDEASFDVTVPELCRRFHMSRRTLQYCFEEVTGLSPTNFLRSIRLNAARRELRRRQARERSVSEIALDWGFSHLSQFAQDYRHLFAELPSETLRSA